MLRGLTINILIMSVPFHFLKNRSKAQNDSETRWQGYETLIPFAVTKGFIWYVPWLWEPAKDWFPLPFSFLISAFLLMPTYLLLSGQTPQPPHKHSALWPGQRCPASEPPAQRHGGLQYEAIILLLVKEKLSDVGCFTWLFFCLIYYESGWGKSHHNRKTIKYSLLNC